MSRSSFLGLFAFTLVALVALPGDARADGDCPAHQEQGGLLCYDKCRGGYVGSANTCRQSGCPGGRRDDGVNCWIDAHSIGGDHSGCPWNDRACWFHWGDIKCPAGYGGAAFGTCHRPANALGKDWYWRNSGDPLWSIRLSTTLRNAINGLVGLVGNGSITQLLDGGLRLFDPIPGFTEFRTTLRDMATDGAAAFRGAAGGCGNIIQGNAAGIPSWDELSRSMNCLLGAVRQGAAAVEAALVAKLRSLMSRFVDAVRNGAGAVNALFDELNRLNIPFLGQLLKPLRETLAEAAQKVGGVFANHAQSCPAKLQNLRIEQALTVVNCFGGAIAAGLAELERLILEKARALIREFVAAIAAGPAKVDELLTRIDARLDLPGLSKLFAPLRDMAKDVLEKGASEFGKQAAPCPDKLQKFSFSDFGAVIACFASATKGALEAAEAALMARLRGLLTQLIDAAKQGKQAVDAAFAELARAGLVFIDEVKKGIADAAGTGGEAFAEKAGPCVPKLQKLLDVVPVGLCLLKAAGEGLGAALDSLFGPIKKCFPAFDIVAFFKAGSDLSLKGIIKTMATGADSALGAVGCLAKIIFPRPIPGLPTIDQMIETLRMSGKRAMTFIDDPAGAFKRESERMMKLVSGALPKLMSWMGNLKSEFRSVLTLDLVNPPLTPFEATDQDEKIKGLVGTFLQPLGKLIDTLGEGMAPKEILDYAKGVIRGPAEAIGLVVFRTFLLGRHQLMKLAKLVVPALLKGATFLTDGLSALKLPPVFVSLAKKAFDTAHDLFGGVAAAVLELLGLKDTAEQLVGGLVDAFDDLKGVSGRMTQLSSTADATELIAAMNGGMSEAERKAKLAEASAELLAAQKAMAPARQATTAAEQGVQDAAEKATDAQKSAADEANSAESKAQERVRAAGERVEQLDPDKAMERTIGTVWETFSEAGLKVLWDSTASIGKLLSDAMQKLATLAADVGFAVLSTVLSAIPFTTTYGPVISDIVGFAFNILMNFVGVGKSLFFSMVLPELRALVRDQLVSMKTLFTDMYRDPAQRVTLQRFGSSFTQLLDRLGPAADSLKKVRETVKLGMNGLLVGPLGQLFKALPPGLFAALSKAVSTGVELLRKLAEQALVTGAKAVAGAKASGGKIDVKEVATAIITEMKDPVIDWLVGQLPEGDPDSALLGTGLRDGLGAAADAALAKFKTHPASLLNPKAVLGIIAEGLGAESAQKAIARFLTRELKLPVFEGSIANALKTVLPMIQDVSKLRELFHGGVLGFLRKLVFILQPSLENIVLGKLPPKRQAVFKAAFDKAFARVLEPGEFEAVLKGGLGAIIGKLVELCHEPITDLLLTDFPEGTLKEAVRSGIASLGKRASSPDFIKSLSETGLPAIIGEVLSQPAIARAGAELVTAAFGDASLTDSVQKAFVSSASELRTGKLRGVLKNGLRGVLVQFGPLIAKYVAGRIVGEQKPLEAFGATLEAAMKDAVEALQAPGMKPGAIKGLGRRLLDRVRAVAAKLNEKLLAKAGGKATPATTLLGGVVRKLASKMNVGEKLKRITAALAEVSKLEGGALPVVAAAEVPK